jgi:hypothetical protein
VEQLPEALAPLAAYKQFIVYKLIPSLDRVGKTDKMPVDFRTGQIRNAHEPAIWCTAAEAIDHAKRMGAPHGVGFVFTDADPFWFLDIDGAWDAQMQQWSHVALALCQRLSGCAVEVSSSHTGLHIFGTGDIPRHGTRNTELHLEFYHTKRFVALTGINAAGSAAYAPPALAALVAEYFPPIGDGSSNAADWWTEAPVAAWRGPANDADLLRRALQSKSARSQFGASASFQALWDADPGTLATHWPPDKAGHAYNASHADMALAQHLAFWTGNNAQRMYDMMWQSELVRDKWHARDGYVRDTIRAACALQTEWCQDKAVELPGLPTPAQTVPAPSSPASPAPAPQLITGSTFLGPDQQVQLFAGCCYVADIDRIMIPSGVMMKDRQFRTRYGGLTFSLDAGNERTTRNAWEAFTESSVYRFPRADASCFRPLLPAGALIEENGRALVNRYVPIDIPRMQGDVSRLWAHLRMLLPAEQDVQILMAYMAACVQHQGHKFRWAPLIQGVEGNGKTLLANMVQRAVGKHYTHWPLAKDIANNFNAWLEGKTLYIVDETFIDDKRLDVMETLKPMITSEEGIQITLKGVDSVTRDICGNFLFFTNHPDGLRKSRNDRRIAPLFTAQQRAGDLAATGMTEAYFEDFTDWLKRRDGYAIVADFLWTYPIPPELNPRSMARAPQTSSTDTAIREGLGAIEQNILEAIEQDEPMFRGGWVSSAGIKRVADALRRSLPQTKYNGVMNALGYVPHPGLPDGRSNNRVMPEAQRSRLYVRSGTPAAMLTNGAEIAAAYQAAQVSQ